MSENNNTGKQRNTTIAFLKPTKYGMWSADLNDHAKLVDALSVITQDEPGGKFSVRKIQSVNKSTGEEFESNVLEYITSARVKEMTAKREQNGTYKSRSAESDL